MDRGQIVATARGWLGTPWVHQQHAKKRGCDCAGFMLGVVHELGMFLDVEQGSYGYVADGTMEPFLDSKLLRVPRNGLKPGDIALFKMGRLQRHLGFIVEIDGQMGVLHCDRGRGVIEHRCGEKWERRILHGYTLEVRPDDPGS